VLLFSILGGLPMLLMLMMDGLGINIGRFHCLLTRVGQTKTPVAKL